MPSFIPPVESILRRAVNLCEAEYAHSPEVAACSPGRVNLIGEHTDYNEGFVLPMALPMVTVVAGRANGTKKVRFYTAINEVDNPHKVEISLNGEIKAGKVKWANYLKGVIAKFKEAPVPGFDAVIVSSVPVGGGVSSSAALEIATYTFLEALVGKKTTSHITKALACQEAEHHFAGMPCGIMDQLVSILGRENEVLLIDCRTLEVTYVPFNNSQVVVLMTNSNVHHELSSSEYALRKKQCEEAAKLLGKKSLRDAEESDILALEEKKVDKTLIARARHVITENKRTKQGAEALQRQDFETFGKLMIQSHNSLRYDYEVSCKELDELVEAALQVDGVYGSRMTGGGFGGCTVTLVKRDALEKCISNIKQTYSGDPVFYICKPSAGARQLLL